MRSTVTFRLLVALIIVVLVASACGGDDSPDLADVAGVDDSGGDSSAGDDTGAEDDGSGDEASGSDDSDGGGGGGDGTAYCVLAGQEDQLIDEFDPTGGPEAVQRFYERVAELIDEAILTAPEELREDFAVLRNTLTQAILVLEEADWDLFAASDSLEELVEDPEVAAAEERIDAYDTEVCGLEPDDLGAATDGGEGAAGDDFENPFGELGMSADLLEQMLSTEFGREAFAQGMAESGEITVEQALCILDELDVESLLGMASGTADAEAVGPLFEAFDACGVEASAIMG